MTSQDSSASITRSTPSRLVARFVWVTRAVLGAATLALAACGGGGGGGPTGPILPGVVALKVKDSYGSPVAGAVVSGPQGSTSTSAQGVALVFTDVPPAAASVTVSRESFVTRSLSVSSKAGETVEVTITLDRATAPAGGSLTTTSGVAPSVDGAGQQVTFEIELVVVGGDSQPVETLTASNFALSACTPDAANDRFDCVRGAAASDDVAYLPVNATPESATLVQGGTPQPFAAALLLDQSGSIQQTDPTGARLYSAKAFLGGLGTQDQALLAAFAGAPGSALPDTPLTAYGPFKDQAQAPSYYTTLDALAPLVGGNTPLYDSLDSLRQQWFTGSQAPAGLGKAVVVFTDGADNSCADAAACTLRRGQTILAAQQDQVRIFPVALSGGADIAALGELANQTGGALLYADNATQLVPLYGSVGKLMSLSLPTYRLRWTVRTDVAGGFRSGQTLLGRAQVTAGGTTFTVPFVVGLP